MRTEKGFLYAWDGVWYWFAATGITEEAPKALAFAPSEDPMAVAISCARDALSAATGKTLHTETVTRDGFAAQGITDDGMLFAACGALASLLKDKPLPAENLFLCSALTIQGEPAPYAVTEEGVYLDVSHPETLGDSVKALFESLQNQEDPVE